MFRTVVFVASLAALPAFAQTAGDDLPAAETWWDRVGAGFFSDEGLTLLRPEPEIRAHWTALSADDQAAVLERCALLANGADSSDTSGASVPSEQRGSNTELGSTQSERLLEDDLVELPADEGTQREVNAPDMAPDASADTTITGAVNGTEVHNPGDGVQPYTGLAGGVTAEDAQLRPVCTVVAEI
jgi:hypothetical protein